MSELILYQTDLEHFYFDHCNMTHIFTKKWYDSVTTSTYVIINEINFCSL